MTMHRKEITLAATGNGMKSYDTYDSFLDITGGSGNTPDAEVHLAIRNNDGVFAQSWFNLAELRKALGEIDPQRPRRGGPIAMHQVDETLGYEPQTWQNQRAAEWLEFSEELGDLT